MPFEPRILRIDEQPEAGSPEVRADSAPVVAEAKPESWLPAELEALAEQLSEDSAHLLRQYPAVEHPAPRMAELAARMEEAAALSRDRRTSHRALQRYAALAAGLLIAVGAGLWLAQGNGVVQHASLNVDSRTETTSVPVAPKATLVDEPVKNETETVGSRMAAAESAATASAPVLDSEDFMELDSVTQSAVADLVEDGQLRQGTISL